MAQELQYDRGTIMGLLDGLLGGAVGAGVVTAMNSLIQQHGGLQGVVTQLEQQGLGNTVRSWISSGPNQPISAEQVTSA
ncbi:MAG TPA: YidB family protein, partial [Steroidobacteraceae bacterium]|nr:YidB family protein [Steroidobacteraceae bacterium]